VLARELAAADLVLSTAFVPGRRAPVLITAEMVEGMKPGSAIVDIAAAEGGNCELTVPGEVVDHQGVCIAGAALLAADMPAESSALYARNVREVVAALLDEEGVLHVDPDHTEVGPALIVHGGTVRHEPTAALLAQEGD
jgi:H+-translocating NAD(P) transhydrogenase subunit alpha